MSPFTNFVAVDVESTLLPGDSLTKNATISQLSFAAAGQGAVDKEVTTVQVGYGKTFGEALQEFESFVYTNYVKPGKRFCLVSNGRFPIETCLPKHARDAEVALSPTWSKYFDIRIEIGKFQSSAPPSDIQSCITTMALQGTPEPTPGAGACACIVALVDALLLNGHEFVGPLTWDPDAGPQVIKRGPGTAPAASAGGRNLRMRGVPWSAGEEEVAQFFEGYGAERVVISYDDVGKHRGEAYVRFTTDEEADRALQAKHNQMIGTRYIELFPCAAAEMDEAIRISNSNDISSSLCLRLRGIPFSATDYDISNFFATNGVNILTNTIHIQMGHDGRPTGCAFVKCASELDAQRALSLTRSYIGTRYVEIYRASENELNQILAQSESMAASPVMQGTAGTDHVVKLRGLPFQATELDIANFFSNLNIAAQGIHLVYNAENRPSGEAFVEFQTAGDVNGALQKDKQRLGHRYVEVFRSSKVEMQGGASHAVRSTRMNPYPVYGGKGGKKGGFRNNNGFVPRGHMAGAVGGYNPMQQMNPYQMNRLALQTLGYQNLLGRF